MMSKQQLYTTKMLLKFTPTSYPAALDDIDGRLIIQLGHNPWSSDNPIQILVSHNDRKFQFRLNQYIFK